MEFKWSSNKFYEKFNFKSSFQFNRSNMKMAFLKNFCGEIGERHKSWRELNHFNKILLLKKKEK